MSLKNEPFICPFCLSAENVESLDNGVEDMCAYEKLHCCACDVEWEDNFSLSYCGYNIATDSGHLIFDEKGEEI